MNEGLICTSPAFFLGANTPGGFYSLFDELYKPEEGWRLYIIKGGPGTGKSTLMKGIADEADKRGVYCERIFCSSDPKSLDGVILPRLKISICDGTPPHVCEPRFPGVSEVFVDLGSFRNDKILREHSAEVIEKTLENSVEHKKCIGFLRAAASVDADRCFITGESLDMMKLKKFALRLAENELKSSVSAKGEVKKRFLSAVTPDGEKVFYDTYAAFCEKSIVLSDSIGIAAPVILSYVLRKAEKLGLDVIQCLCPLCPEKTEHVILPDLKLGFFTSSDFHAFKGEAYKTVHCARFFTSAEIRKHRNRLNFNKKAKNEFINEAVNRLRSAKKIHDELEDYYKAAMDFDAVQREGERLRREIFEA